MKVQNITDIEGFFKVVDSCEGSRQSTLLKSVFFL